MINIGKLGKLHGVQGAFRLHIMQDAYLDSILETEVIFLEKNGQMIPCFINEIKESGPHILITFEEMPTREAALPFTNCQLFLRASDMVEEVNEESDELAYAYLKGFNLVDLTTDFKGVIIEIEEYPQQEMAIVQKEDRKWLIPLNPDLIDQIDEKNRTIFMKLPLGLTDM